MKALFVWNGVASEQVSGGDNYTLNLINLSKIEKDVIVSRNAANLIARRKVRGILPTRKNKSQSLIILGFIYLIRTIQSIFFARREKKPYNLLITSTPFFFDIIPAVFARAKNKVVVIFHIVPKRKSVNLATFFRFLAAGIEKGISYFIIRHFFDTIIAGNEQVKKELRARFPNQRIISTNASINTRRIDYIKEPRKDSNLACFTGRITSQKGVFDIVEIMKELNKNHPKLKIIMTGEGPDMKRLKDKIKESKVKSITLRGFVSEEEKYKILKRAKFFFFPSYEEGWGISLAEALYCNDICLCYSLPHYKGIFSNYPVYARLGDKKDFIAKFEKFCSSKPSKSQKGFIKKYDDQAVVDSLFREFK